MQLQPWDGFRTNYMEEEGFACMLEGHPCLITNIDESHAPALVVTGVDYLTGTEHTETFPSADAPTQVPIVGDESYQVLGIGSDGLLNLKGRYTSGTRQLPLMKGPGMECHRQWAQTVGKSDHWSMKFGPNTMDQDAALVQKVQDGAIVYVTVRSVMDQEAVVSLEQFEQTIDDPLVGSELAGRVAATLMAKPGDANGFTYCHQGFCGDTVYFQDGAFHIAEVNDGYADKPYVPFASKAEFVEWLGQPSNQDLRGYREGKLKKEYPDNQTITIERLRQYVN